MDSYLGWGGVEDALELLMVIAVFPEPWLADDLDDGEEFL